MYLTLSTTERLKRQGYWETMAILGRTYLFLRVLVLTLSMRIYPCSGVYMLKSRSAMVVLPVPDWPTMATLYPGLMRKERP